MKACSRCNPWTDPTYGLCDKCLKEQDNQPYPAIESIGNGWFRVLGSKVGPIERFGIEAAESTLEEIMKNT